MEYEPKQILTSGCDSTWLGEIRMFHSPLLPVCSIFSVNSVNMDQTWISNLNFLWELTIVIPTNRTFSTYIFWSPPSIKDDLQSNLAQIRNQDTFCFRTDHNLSQWDIQTFWILHRGSNSIAGYFDSRDCQKICYSKVESGFLDIDSRATS